MQKIATALSIAGSDSSGGAGIQADLKTMLANDVYGMTAITALTAQNTLGVTMVQVATPDFLAAQLDAVFSDIYPQAVKVGMVANAELISVIAEKLREYKAQNVVVDPVMVATSGANLIDKVAVKSLQEKLFPCATIITPNIPEMQVLANKKIIDEADMADTALALAKEYNLNVLGKGGHLAGNANDILATPKGEIYWYKSARINNPNTHGTGCTLSSAIAANLAKGYELKIAVKLAKEYLTGALKAGLNLGHGSGPLNHGFANNKA